MFVLDSFAQLKSIKFNPIICYFDGVKRYAYPHKTVSHLSMSPIEKDLKMLMPDLTSSCSILNSIAVADP